MTFTYPGAKTPAISNVSFAVEAGSTCALVDLSSADKSTIAELVGRFWNADEGPIEVGGADVPLMFNTCQIWELNSHIYPFFIFAI